MMRFARTAPGLVVLSVQLPVADHDIVNPVAWNPLPVTVPVDDKGDGIDAPSAAAVEGSLGKWAPVINDKGEARKRKYCLGHRQNREIECRSYSPGDQITRPDSK